MLEGDSADLALLYFFVVVGVLYAGCWLAVHGWRRLVRLVWWLDARWRERRAVDGLGRERLGL